MNEQRRLIVVDSSVLPEVILKVLAVKKLLASREEKALPLHASASASPAAPTTSTGTVYSPTMTR